MLDRISQFIGMRICPENEIFHSKIIKIVLDVCIFSNQTLCLFAFRIVIWPCQLIVAIEMLPTKLKICLDRGEITLVYNGEELPRYENRIIEVDQDDTAR